MFTFQASTEARLSPSFMFNHLLQRYSLLWIYSPVKKEWFTHCNKILYFHWNFVVIQVKNDPLELSSILIWKKCEWLPCFFWACYLPPKIIIAGKTGTVQSGAFKGRQSNDAPIIVPFGLGERLNWICRPVNNFCRSKTGFGLYFMPPKSYGNVFIEMP